MKHFLVLFFLLLALSSPLMAQTPGTLDTSFGEEGIMTLSSFYVGMSPGHMALDPSGKIILTGVSAFSSSGLDVMLARARAEGAFDTSFSGDGLLTVTDSFLVNRGRSIVLQADGKYVVGTDGYVARFNPAGTFDASFGSGGQVTSSTTDIDRVLSVLLQSDGKMIAVGDEDGSFPHYLKITRLNSGGSLDTSFDSDGRAVRFFGTDVFIFGSGVIQPDGKILVGGYTYPHRPPGSNGGVLLRYHPTGGLDDSFGVGGVVSFTGFCCEIEDIALQSDGKVLTVGSNQLRRFHTNGSADTTFGDGGIVTLPIGVYGHGVVTQWNGKIVVLAATGVAGTDNVTEVILYLEDGSLDESYGTAGIASLNLVGSSEYVSDILLQPDGKALVLVRDWPTEALTNLARLHGDPPPPPPTTDLSLEFVNASYSRGRFIFAVLVVNNGSVTAHDVGVEFSLSADLLLSSLRPSTVTCSGTAGRNPVCSVGDLAPGARRRISFSYAGASPGTTIDITAGVSSSTGDPDTSNNSDTATVPIPRRRK